VRQSNATGSDQLTTDRPRTALAATYDSLYSIAILRPDQKPMVLNKTPHRKGPGVVSCEKLHVQSLSPTGLSDELSARSIRTNINVHEITHDTDNPELVGWLRAQP
jgi:hypothetical protein